MSITLKQQNELRTAVGLAPKSAAVDYAVPATPRVSDDKSLDEMFSSAGANREMVDAQVLAEQNKKRQDEIAALTERETQLNRAVKAENLKDDTIDTVAGVGAGALDIVRNTYNGVLTLANAAEDYAASKGIGAGDLISDANKWQDNYGEVLGSNGKVSRSIVNYAGPLLAAVSSGGGTLLGTGINAAYNFLAIDPKQSRIADELKDTGLAEVPIAMDAINYLKTKPSDTELEARFKNLLEGAGIDVGLGGIFYGATKAYQAISKARNPKVVQEVAQKIVAAEERVKAPKPVTPREEAAVAASDKAISSPETGSIPVTPQAAPTPGVTADQIRAELNPPRLDDSVEQMDLFEKQWAVIDPTHPGIHVSPEGNVSVRLSDDAIVDRFAAMMQDTKNVEMLAAPMTDEDLVRAASIMKNESSVIDSLAQWTPEQGPLNDKQTLVMKMVLSKADEAMKESAALAAQGGDVALLKFGKDLENYNRINEIRQGINREQGKALRSTQVLAHLAGLGEKEAVAALGAQGRAKLAEDLINKYGGRDNLTKMAKNMSFIREMSDVAKTPNSDFTARMGDIVQKSTWMKIDDAITKVALNGMLSSPMTSMKAFISNAATTSKTVIDNYIAVGIGALRPGDAKTLAEANAHLKASFVGLFESIAPAAETIAKGPVKAGTERLARMDLTPGAQQVLSQEDLYEMAGGAWAAKFGTSVDKAVGIPTRVLQGVDTYWQMVNYKGVVSSEATKVGMRQGLEGEALASFVEQYSKNVPATFDKVASEIAATNTFAKGLTGFAASIDEVIENAPIPFKRVVIPFVKTNLNMIEYSVVNSPMAFLAPSFRDAMRVGGRARDEALAKVVSTTAALGGIVALAESGLINGPTTENPEIERALKDNKSVPLPTSVKVGDSWVSLKGLEPLSTLVDTAALLSKAAGYVSEEEYADAANMFKVIIAETITPETLTSNLSDLLQIMGSDDKNKASQVLAWIATRFTPMGGALTDIRQTMDPVTRNTRPVPSSDAQYGGLKEFYSLLKNRFSNQVPFLSKDLPAERNLWGERLILPDGLGPDAIAPIAATSGEGLALKKSLEWMDDYYELNKDTAAGLNKLNIQMPMRSIKNPMASVQYDLTPKEYSAYVLLNAGINPTTGDKLLGKTLKEAVTEVFTKYDALGRKPEAYEPVQYARMVGEISKVFTVYRSVANRMILDFGDVQAKMAKQAEQARAFEQFSAGGGQ